MPQTLKASRNRNRNRHSVKNNLNTKHTLKRNKWNKQPPSSESTLNGPLFLVPVTSPDIIQRINESTKSIRHLENMTDDEWITYVSLKKSKSHMPY